MVLHSDRGKYWASEFRWRIFKSHQANIRATLIPDHSPTQQHRFLQLGTAHSHATLQLDTMKSRDVAAGHDEVT